MQKLMSLGLFLLITLSSLSAQKFFTREGNITFTSETPIETIEATNQTVTAVLDSESSRLEFAVLIKAFQFEKALMQEHFNENYMESSTYPKATFKGSIADGAPSNWSKAGSYDVSVEGTLTIHGVSKEVSVPGQIIVGEGNVAAKAEFVVAVADYDIEIPSVVADNIAKEVAIAVDVSLQPLNN